MDLVVSIGGIADPRKAFETKARLPARRPA